MKENIEIQIGTKKTEATWVRTFKRPFLVKNGWKFYSLADVVCIGLQLKAGYVITVQTKHGELVVHDGDSITYLGHCLWDVRKEDKHES